MPELPDLVHIESALKDALPGRRIDRAIVLQPVVLRVAIEGEVASLIEGHAFDTIRLHGPFIVFGLSGGRELVVNLMVAGRLQYQRPGEKPEGHRCLSLVLDDGSTLHVCDDRKMAKVYLVTTGCYGVIPRFESQGVPVLSGAFTPDAFRELARRHSRKQVRVFINDQTILSAIGNAYADEILFEARVHPKTPVGRLGPSGVEALFRAIRDVMEWGIRMVAGADRPIQEKVRDHMKVRGRKGLPCPRCGTTIRREGVRGFDVFFCPSCQPASRAPFVDWRSLPKD